jgi:hypothetical protein
MIRRLGFWAILAGFSLACSVAWAQSVISARSGTVHYIEGKVLVNGQEVESKFGKFPEIKDGEVFRTEEGRAEVILTPGVFLRLGENSSVSMLSSRLTDTRMEVLGGSALIECAELLKDNALTFRFQDKTILFQKKGLFRIDSDPARLRVYNGEAVVVAQGATTTVKEGREVGLNGVLLAAQRFNKEEAEDSLYVWAKRRAGYLAMANVSAARKIQSSGYGLNSWTSSGWFWNPYFGMFTYLPLRGIYTSPFGYQFWSPYSIASFYARPIRGYSGGGGGYSASQSGASGYNSALGYSTASRGTSYGGGSYSSGGMSSSVGSSAAAASSGSSGGRGSSAGAGGGGTSSGSRR